MTGIKPQQSAPDLSVATLNGDDWSLSAQSLDNFSMIVPKFDQLLGALDFVLTQQYPARGEA